MENLTKELDRVVKQEIFFERYKYASAYEVISALNMLVNNLVKQYSTIGTLRRSEIRAELKKIEEEFNLIYGNYHEGLKVELATSGLTFATVEASDLGIDINKKTFMDETFNIDNDRVLGYTLGGMIESQSAQHLSRFKKKFTALMLAGENPDDFATQLGDVVVGKTAVQIRTIARTYAKHMREVTRDKLEKDYGVDFPGWISLATLDSRTSGICIRLDHNVYLKSEGYNSRSEIPGIPPRHFNCRSILIRLSKSTLSFTRGAVGDEGAQQVYAKTTFESFLRRNPETAIKLLGRKKAELYFSGKFPITRFITEDGSFLTNDEIMSLFFEK